MKACENCSKHDKRFNADDFLFCNLLDIPVTGSFYCARFESKEEPGGFCEFGKSWYKFCIEMGWIKNEQA